MKKQKIFSLHSGMTVRLVLMASATVMVASADLRAAVGMSIVVLLATLLSSALISVVGKWIPEQVKLPANVLILTGIVSLLNMLMQAHFPVAVDLLGVHLAALAASPVLFREKGAEQEDDEKLTIGAAMATAGFLSGLMVICALIRELLGNASIWGHAISFLEPYKVPILSGAFGGYLVLAIVLAVVNAIGMRGKKEEEGK